MTKTAEVFYENKGLTELRAKARALYAENQPGSIKELLFENLVEQAYHTGRLDAITAELEHLLEKNHEPR